MIALIGETLTSRLMTDNASLHKRVHLYYLWREVRSRHGSLTATTTAAHFFGSQPQPACFTSRPQVGCGLGADLVHVVECAVVGGVVVGVRRRSCRDDGEGGWGN